MQPRLDASRHRVREAAGSWVLWLFVLYCAALGTLVALSFPG